MQRIDGRFIFSASDLNNALECAHLVRLERLVALGERVRPEATPATDLLSRKGEEHEAHQLELYRRRYGTSLVEFETRIGRTVADLRAAEERTAGAMAAGAPLIYQATFFDGVFLGRTDFLRRVERPCAQWAWSYEVVDSKLALSPKPYYLIQLANYSEHLARVQGSRPYEMHVVLGSGAERSFRLDDYAAYYRNLKARFMERMAVATNGTYPFETGHCAICRWDSQCARQRSDDDHLSLVANIRHDQIRRLEDAGFATMAALAGAPDAERPRGMPERTFQTLRSQAELQHRARVEHANFYELLEHEGRNGFGLLPLPDGGDVFFDMEGDPLYAPDHGLEYLFGAYLVADDSYRTFWARSDRDEKAAFEKLIDFLIRRREQYPQMHVYHYANYEQAALRRLMGQYGTREAELDSLLRAEVFVDLYSVARQALRISQPSYSIKKFEAFYGMKRNTDVKRGDDSIVMFETWLFNGDESILDDIQRYNEDDCRSTYLLREWLLARRGEYGEHHAVAWFEERREEITEEETDPELVAALLHDLDPPLSLASLRARTDDARARWLLGHLLEYDRREAKPAFWQMFDRYKNLDGLLEFDHEALAGLQMRADIAPEKIKRSYIYTYDFPEQLHHIDGNVLCPYTQNAAGTVVSIDDEQRIVRIKLSAGIVPQNLRAIIPGGPIVNREQRKALRRIGAMYLDRTLAAKHPATVALLLAKPQSVESQNVTEAVPRLDGSYLFVQGPPGSGKSTVGASVIVDALAAGKRVGIVARGHKPIHHLLHKIEDEALRRGSRFVGLKKSTSSNDESAFNSRLERPMIASCHDNAAFEVAAGHQLAAGTPWLFAREALTGKYDVLFVDEAGQISLADALACSLAARNVVLLGDPLQLAQVSQGSHPIGTDLSILEHVLGNRDTVPLDEGIFLETSFRMHPAIAQFISEHVYEGRLRAAPQTHGNMLRAAHDNAISEGLQWLPVVHRGNGRSSQEEADAIVRAVEAMAGARITVWGSERALKYDDIIVVSPFNAQRVLLRQTLAARGYGGVRVGTVDKFQGQEAPVVFYSMATSGGDDIPRDLAFLFEKNRFNVALSRAQCLSILVCSPELLSVRCKTPEQMALVNLLCAFVETSQAAR
ncbi:MAG: TM0106 family RecB-like putative nuclease [Candidatus Aquilonibacter sp.]